jgi:hypothetical protein
VLFTNLGGGLLDHHRSNDLARQPGIARPRLGAAADRARRCMAQQQFCFRQQLFGTGQSVDNAQCEGTPGRKRFAGEHQRQCLGSADQARQARGSAPARVDTQHHFRQGNTGFVVIRGDPMTAGKNQLGASAHAGAMNRRDCRAGQARKRLVDALTVFDVLQHGVVFRVINEFLDVRANGKTRSLGRVNDHSARLVDRQAFDDLLELVQYGAGYRIDAAVSAIKRQRDNAFVVFAGFPVIEAQSFEHGHADGGGRALNHTVLRP